MECKKCSKQAMYTVRGLCEECVISPDEMRFIRREIINYHLQIGMTILKSIKWNVRFVERGAYGHEMKVYS